MSSTMGAQRSPWVESIVSGTKDRATVTTVRADAAPCAGLGGPPGGPIPAVRPAAGAPRNGVCSDQKRRAFPFLRSFLAGPPPRAVAQPPSIVAAGDDPEHLAELLDGVEQSLLVNKGQLAYEAGKCEKMSTALFKIFNTRASRLLAAHRVRTLAASAGSAGKGCWVSFC